MSVKMTSKDEFDALRCCGVPLYVNGMAQNSKEVYTIATICGATPSCEDRQGFLMLRADANATHAACPSRTAVPVPSPAA